MTDAPTLAHLLVERAVAQPARTAYTFLGEEPATFDYAGLDRAARAIAGHLASRYQPGDRALLLHPPGLEYVAALFGCWYAGVVPVPAYPPRANSSAARLDAVAVDSDPSVALTVAAVEHRVSDVPAMATDTLEPVEAAELPLPQEDSVALLQYTSGSTGTPKGVVLDHRNLMSNLDQIGRSFGTGEHSSSVIWLPPYHDMGLIGGLLQPLYAGFPVTLMSPMSFLRSPLHWLRTMSANGATISGGPNFAYELAVRRIQPEQRAELDLSRWQVAFSGAEPVRAETLESFAEYFAPCGFRAEAFYPCYGLAEATLMVTGGSIGAPPVVSTFDPARLEQGRAVPTPGGRPLVGCGDASADNRLLIVDPDTGVPAPDVTVGEIWLSGPGVARGYRDRPVETERDFAARLITGEGPFLRTGDLGFRHNGELYVTGRLKDLIIIRGRNHYPQDIEFTVQQSHPALRPEAGAAFSALVDGEEQLVVVHELDRVAHEHAAAVVAAVRAAVAERHELRVHAVMLIRPVSIPRTTSGKIQRRECRRRFLDGSLNTVATAVVDTAVEAPTPEALSAADRRPELVATTVSACAAAALRTSVEQLDPLRPLTEHGMDSVAAVGIAHRIETATGVVIPLGELLGGATPTQITEMVLCEFAVSGQEELTATGARTAPLSQGQSALWTVHQVAPDPSVGNLAFALRFSAGLDVCAFEDAWRVLARRHPVLRTVYQVVDGRPVQVIRDEAGEFVLRENASAAEVGRRLHELAEEPFDLVAGPVLCVHLVAVAPEEHVMLLVVHHIAADFLSIELLLSEFADCYRAQQLPEPRLDYAGYVSWQESLLAGPRGDRLAAYWADQLSGASDALRLPADRPRPAVASYRGDTCSSTVDGEVVRELGILAERHGTTLFTVLLAAYHVLLHRYTDQRDLVVGVPLAGRGRSELAALAGYLSNTMPIRARVEPEQTFAEVLGQVRETMLGALDHQDYPFPALLAGRGGGDLSRHPIYQTTFTFQAAYADPGNPLAALAVNAPGIPGELAGLPVESMSLRRSTSQFDLALAVAETRDGLAALWTFSTDLFDVSTVERMADHFTNLLRAVAAEPECPVPELGLLGDAERNRIVHEWNDTERDVEQPGLVELFDAQAAASPDAVAFHAGDDVLTYRELRERAGRLAGLLRDRGAGPERAVGVCLERTLDLPVALLAVLRTGACYLPLDPALPADRLTAVLDQGAPVAVVTDQRQAERCGWNGPVRIDADRADIEARPPDFPAVEVSSRNLAYLIFTSGSTGVAKGVAVEHRQVRNRLDWMWRHHPFADDEIGAVKTSIGFVDSLWELTGPLLRGVPSVLLADETVRDPYALVTALEEHRVTRLWLVPTLLRALLETHSGLDARLPALRFWVASGEPLPAELARRFAAAVPAATLYNLYGTSEVWDATWQDPHDPTGPTVHIGRPIENVRTYVLDAAGRPVPQGVPGELYVAGDGLARGYLGRPGPTAQRFVPDPHRPGQRMYRTGDLVRWRDGGELEYLERLDDQVKIRGFRVELGEVEAALDEHPDVHASAVVVRPDPAGEQRLVAYVAASPAPTTSALRRHLRPLLPRYLVPSVFVALDELPVNANGKVDRAALPDPDGVRPLLDDEFVSPKTLTERAIADVYTGVLGIDRVGVHDNFFDLGGTSLSLVQAHRQIVEQLDVRLSVIALFQHPTIAALAGHLADGAANGSRRMERGRQAAVRRRRLAGEVRTRRNGGVR